MKSFVFLLPFLILFVPSKKEVSISDEICLSAEEQKLYALIMGYRKSKKLDPIPLSAKLSKVAKVHAQDLSEHYDFKPDNKCNPHSWSKKGKWSSCCYTSDHKQAKCMWDKPKEIAGYEGNGYEIAYWSSAGASAVEGLDGWKKSSGHNPLLINSGIWEKVKWKSIGVALYGEYGIVWFGEIEDEESVAGCE
jgi:uncharacterized protein YkwD